jgi:hypothetical protein
LSGVIGDIENNGKNNQPAVPGEAAGVVKQNINNDLQ